MARKKVEKPVMTTAEAKAKLRLVRLELSEEYHRKLRIAAAEDDTTMAEMARNLIQQYLDSRKRGGVR